MTTWSEVQAPTSCLYSVYNAQAQTSIKIKHWWTLLTQWSSTSIASVYVQLLSVVSMLYQEWQLWAWMARLWWRSPPIKIMPLKRDHRKNYDKNLPQRSVFRPQRKRNWKLKQVKHSSSKSKQIYVNSSPSQSEATCRFNPKSRNSKLIDISWKPSFGFPLGHPSCYSWHDSRLGRPWWHLGPTLEVTKTARKRV